MNSIKRPPKKPKANPITAAITSWLSALPAPPNNNEIDNLLNTSPKRWSLYEPMVLLPSGSFTSAPWPDLVSSLTPQQMSPLWLAILQNISPSSKIPLTHLAVNEGIPLHTSHHGGSEDGEDGEDENLLRSPSSLRPLYGGFGSTNPNIPPSEEDFNKAFWVSTKQNGITQVWAPRWTMFSRGNVKEKARVLGFRSSRTGDGGGKGKWAVDLYAGIGYFVFSYVKMGMRVLCWELNAWSVEGLRRGAEANGWSVRVVQGDELDRVKMEDVVRGVEEIVVFLEDNKEAGRKIGALEGLEVVHVNCGFLPSSEGSWRRAWEIQRRGLRAAEKGWLHLHQNVAVRDIEGRKREVQGMMDEWGRGEVKGEVEHVEQVKTFAPGVWHCVFDVCLTKPSVAAVE
ncbi:tRNA wybutosine-synthesizing protein [Immersiella caudata]|uniref:tRNA wybutosine-synthesizing protein 2 n=1 Tax=Immersiella caudata TaxID=314043 RepID=A0AA40C6V1_9PEZI|nr:tRNA wybutosine-synthesizing protein [Immersiella caudata]